MIGHRFGRLTVIGVIGGKWQCQCDCGNVLTKYRSRFRLYQSCGCAAREKIGALRRTHAMTSSRIYKAWCNMKTRCLNRKSPRYKDYGGRGICICEEWITSFEAFVADMGECPPGMTIERRDNNLGYTPQNCYWTPKSKQPANTRRNVYVVVNDKKVWELEAERLLGMRSRYINWNKRTGLTAQQICDQWIKEHAQ